MLDYVTNWDILVDILNLWTKKRDNNDNIYRNFFDNITPDSAKTNCKGIDDSKLSFNQNKLIKKYK